MSVNIRLKNEGKMKSYLSCRIGRTITEKEFSQTINYFEEVAHFILEERDGKPLIREGASLEVEVEDESYEVWVTFDTVIQNNQFVMIVDFDYTYDDFC